MNYEVWFDVDDSDACDAVKATVYVRWDGDTELASATRESLCSDDLVSLQLLGGYSAWSAVEPGSEQDVLFRSWQSMVEAEINSAGFTMFEPVSYQ